MFRAGAVLLISVCCVAALAQGRVDLKVRSVGFPSTVDERFVARDGQWMPVQVDLTYYGGQPIQGELRIEAPDLDGDRLSYIESPVALTPNTGIKHVWCYVAAQFIAGHELRVSFIVDGTKIAGEALPQAAYLPNRKHLVVDISDVTLAAKLQGIAQQADTISDTGLGSPRPFTVEYVVSRMACTDLPDRWFGLEAVDTLIWDEPDPAKVSDLQIEALKSWVRNGGKLVLGVGSNWQKVQHSALAELLPYKGDETTITTRRLPEVLKALTGATKKTELNRDVAVVMVSPATVPPSRRLLVDYTPKPVALLSMKFYGSGRTICAATSLRELLDAAGSPERFAQKFLDAFPIRPEFLKSEAASAYSMSSLNQRLSTYDAVVDETSFEGAGKTLLYSALIFVAAYAALAVLSYVWLARKSVAHLSWSVFAGIAIVASAVSLGMVGASRGFSRGVKSSEIVDLDADTSEGRGPVWFGYSSSLRQFVDLSLPGGGNYLRPLAALRSMTATYATPLRYESTPGKALLHNTPMRATLKQFEGYWTGKLNGTIHANLRVDTRTGYLTSDSSIRNDLTVPVKVGFLLYLDPRVPGSAPLPPRPADYMIADRQPARKSGPPSDVVLVARLPALEPGKTIAGWLAEAYAKRDQEIAAWQQDESRSKPEDLPSLASAQLGWATRTYTEWVTGEKDPFETLVLSTRSLFVPVQPGNPDTFMYTASINLDGVVNRDISHWLSTGNAVLLLLSPTPGPATLHRNGEAMPARDGYTIYRVRVPLTYTGGRAAAETQPSNTEEAAPTPESAGENQ